MAKISLRAYNREIENLIDHSAIDQAIAHCKQILKFYPKHLDTYRLLGKAYIENQRYAEAADILQRVLSVSPDDFVAQLGMSIIREDEGNLDAAIYSMERAYEIQPSNSAIQDELKRLYGRRDGVEPPKIRLTRGALVRMYVRGELYPQAIAEIRAALSENPDRVDLEIILARIYYLTNRKVEATEICSRLVGKLPYCYEANWLLSEILPGTSRADDVKIYQKRLQELDPYLIHINSTTPKPEDVPDNAIMVEYLDISTMQIDTRETPSWASSAGIQWEGTEPEEEALPEWMNGIGQAESSETLEVAESSIPQDEISEVEDLFPPTIPTQETGLTESPLPDWFEAAGWAVSEGDSTSNPETQGTGLEEENPFIAEAEIPDWLQGMAPSQESPVTEEGERTQWLDELLPGEGELPTDTQPSEPEPTEWLGLPQDGEVTAEGMPPSLDDNTPSGETPSDGLIPGASPDWLEPSSTENEPIIPAELPDWLQGLGVEQEAGEATSSPVDTTIPSWISDLQPQEDNLSSEQTEARQETEMMEAVIDDSIPPFDESETLVEQTTDATSFTDRIFPEEGTVGQIPELEAEQPFITDEQEWMEEQSIPELLSESGVELEPVSGIIEPLGEISEKVEEQPAADQLDEDQTFAWLEALAARQGADAEELLTQPDERPVSPDELAIETPELEQEISPAINNRLSEELITEAVTTTNEVEALIPEEEIFHPQTETIPVDVPVDEPQQIMDQVAEPSLGDVIEFIPIDLDETTEEEPVPSVFDETESVSEPTPESFETTWLPEEPPLDQADTAPTIVHQVEMEESPSEIIQPTPVETPPIPIEEDAFAWLEALAAKQGADEAELLTPTDQRTDIPPSWTTEEEQIPPQAEIPEMENEPDLEPIQQSSNGMIEEPIAEPALDGNDQIPDWLSDISSDETTGSETSETPSIPAAETPQDSSEILQEIPTPEMTLESELMPANAPETGQQIPDWLTHIAEEHETAPAEPSEEIPAWIQNISSEGDQIQENTPAQELETGWLTQEAETQPILDVNDEEYPIRAEKELEEKTEGLDEAQAILHEAQEALWAGDLESALSLYDQLIRSDILLEEVIHDLRDATYRYPVDISIWQTLGDAFAKNNMLQEALDAYSKAEDLIR